MNIWIIMIAIGLLTFATRLSFIALLERIKLPVTFQRALRFVPIAILSAIIAPELGYANNVPALTFGNPPPAGWAGRHPGGLPDEKYYLDYSGRDGSILGIETGFRALMRIKRAGDADPGSLFKGGEEKHLTVIIYHQIVQTT